MLLCLVPPVNNTSFPFPQQLSQLPQCTENEAGGWGGESYKEIRESLTSLGRSMGCFTRKMEEDLSFIFNLLPHSQRCLTSSVACVDTLSGCPVLLSLLVVYLPGASWHLGFLSASQGRCFFFFQNSIGYLHTYNMLLTTSHLENDTDWFGERKIVGCFGDFHSHIVCSHIYGTNDAICITNC